MNGEILTFNETDGTSDVTDGGRDDCGREDNAGNDALIDEADAPCIGESIVDEFENVDEREEYERLIKTRFKELFKEDTQRLINKRFKKYKALEEKVEMLEANAKKYADMDSVIAAECEKAVKETEQRLNQQFKAMRLRVVENAVSPRSARPSLDVSRLTKSERASLASRALKGEKIHL